MKTPLVIKLFYLQRFFIHFIFFWSVDKIFFSQRGASTFEISILVGLWGLFALIFEVPSGALADRWSRKKMIVLAAFVHSTAYIVWIFSHSFWGFLLGYLLRGLGGVLESGTVSAFFYDHLKALKQESDYEKYNGRLWVITTISFLTTALVAGTLADKYSFTLVLILSIFSNLIAGIIAITIPDTAKVKSTEEVGYWKFLKNAFRKSVKQPILLQTLVYSATIITAYATLDEYDQLYVSSIGLPLKLFGIWWLLRMGSEAVGGLIAHRFKKFNIQKTLSSIALVCAGILIISAFSKSLFIIPLLALMFGLFSIASILNQGQMQKQIQSHERATILSISEFVVGGGAIVSGLIFGFVANATNPRFAFLIYAFVISTYFVYNFLKGRLRTSQLPKI